MVVKWGQSIDKGGITAEFLVNVSNAFDFLIPGQNIYEFYSVLLQVLLATSKAKLDI